MSEQRILELLSAEADGELPGADRAELERLLAASPAAARFRQDLHRIDSILRKVPDVAPPETLHDRIMRSVSPSPARPRRQRTKQRFGWFSETPFVAVRYGMAAAAGLLVATAFYESRGFSATPDLTELVGSMAPNGNRGASNVLDAYTFAAEGIDGRLSLQKRNGMLLLDIDVDAERPLDILMDLGAAGVRLAALAQTDDPLQAIETDGRVLRLRAHGRRQATALLERAGFARRTGSETINLEFSSEGRLLQRGSLTPAW
jgi:hypothetical protein